MIKEKIKMNNEIIENDYIRIDNDHTLFCEVKRIEFPDINKLEKELKALRKQLKDNNVSLAKTDTIKILRDQKQEYINSVNEYNNTFDKLVIAWEEKIKVGIFTGYSDDKYYNNILSPLKWKLEKMNYRNTLLSKVITINQNIQEIKQELNNGTEFLKVSI
ncbi:hypothetical protein [Aquibacillus saliphilus]|uniref:hypothetical protein n=1 Tax=Aquibacillus saliphilus TaxID=1909422 RepID=UPI001CF08768|nr:hypothetical protein [Aquibacillus saliphilus]